MSNYYDISDELVDPDGTECLSFANEICSVSDSCEEEVLDANDGMNDERSVSPKSDTFAELKHQMKEKMKESHQSVINADIRPIHPEINVYYNSVNVFTGPQGTGKTYSAMDQALKIALVSPQTHLLVYMSKFGEETRDPTVETLKTLLKIPILYLRYDEAEQRFQRLLAYKRLYKRIYDEGCYDRVEDSQIEEIKTELFIDNFDQPFLHTLVLVDDVCNNPLFKPGRYFADIGAICRKVYCSFFLTIQFWKGVSTDIRSNITTAFILGRFSRQKLQHIYHQISTSVPFEMIWQAYKELGTSDKLIINNRTGEVSIELAE